MPVIAGVIRYKNMNKDNRNRAIDAIDILNDILGDLVISGKVLQEFTHAHSKGQLNMEQMVSVQKMCLSNLILALTKWLEFYEHYHDVIPEEFREIVKKTNKTLNEKKVREFRNECIGHIWDKPNKRPLVLSEIMQRLDNIVGGNITEFLRWINDPINNQYPNTLLSIVESLRSKLVSEYEILPSEVIDR